MTFSNSEYLFLLLLLIPYLAWYLLWHLKQAPSISVSTIAPFIHRHKSSFTCRSCAGSHA